GPASDARVGDAALGAERLEDRADALHPDVDHAVAPRTRAEHRAARTRGGRPAKRTAAGPRARAGLRRRGRAASWGGRDRAPGRGGLCRAAGPEKDGAAPVSSGLRRLPLRGPWRTGPTGDRRRRCGQDRERTEYRARGGRQRGGGPSRGDANQPRLRVRFVTALRQPARSGPLPFAFRDTRPPARAPAAGGKTTNA